MSTRLVLLLVGFLVAGGLHRVSAAPDVTPASPATARIVKAAGVVKPRVGAEVRVGSRLSGVVTRLHVQVGDTVRPGQRLAELDNRELLARRAEALAQHQQALAEWQYASARLARQRQIANARVISADDLALAERASAVAAAQVSATQAACDYAQTQLDYTVLVAPIGGVVASVATQEGETVSAGFAAPTFVTLVDLARLEVWAYVDETDIGRIEPGQPATFTVDTYGDEPFVGTVAAIYPKAEIRDNVVDYVAVVRFEPRAGRILRPDMTAIVRLAVPPSETATRFLSAP